MGPSFEQKLCSFSVTFAASEISSCFGRPARPCDLAILTSRLGRLVQFCCLVLRRTWMSIGAPFWCRKELYSRETVNEVRMFWLPGTHNMCRGFVSHASGGYWRCHPVAFAPNNSSLPFRAVVDAHAEREMANDEIPYHDDEEDGMCTAAAGKETNRAATSGVSSTLAKKKRASVEPCIKLKHNGETPEISNSPRAVIFKTAAQAKTKTNVRFYMHTSNRTPSTLQLTCATLFAAALYATKTLTTTPLFHHGIKPTLLGPVMLPISNPSGSNRMPVRRKNRARDASLICTFSPIRQGTRFSSARNSHRTRSAKDTCFSSASNSQLAWIVQQLGLNSTGDSTRWSERQQGRNGGRRF